MITDIRKHTTHYALLAGWLALMVAAFALALGNEVSEAAVVILTGTGYVLWGIVHHYLIKDLTAKITAEYVLMAILTITILTAVLLNR